MSTFQNKSTQKFLNQNTPEYRIMGVGGDNLGTESALERGLKREEYDTEGTRSD
jgi:hypothetical protein